MIKKVLITLFLVLFALIGCDLFTGAQGPAGIDGTDWLTGSGVPEGSIGIDGDFYLDISNSDVYQKIAGAWVLLLNIQGQAGVDSVVWLTGTGVPDNADGANNDFYLDAATSDVYFKSSGIWSFLLSISGQAGVDGAAGATWLSGVIAPDNADGVDSDFYFNTSNGDVYEKGAGVWVLTGNVFGADGADGLDGADAATWFSGSGAPGAIGSDGDYYFDTGNGDVYVKSGTWSVIANLTGATGGPGAGGTDGATWLTGTAHPDDGVTGVDGDFYLETDTANTYEKVAGVWVFRSNIAGKKEFQISIQVHSNSNPIGSVAVSILGASYGNSGSDGTLELSFDTVTPVDFDLTRELFVSVTHPAVTPEETTNPLPVPLEIVPQIFFPDPVGARVLRIDDMIGTNVTQITSVNGTSFVGPHWVEVDYANGRIYIIDNNEAATTGITPDTIFRIDRFTELEQSAQMITLDLATVGTNVTYAPQLSLTSDGGMYVPSQENGWLFYFPDSGDFSNVIADTIITGTFIPGLVVAETGLVIWSETRPESSESNIRAATSILNGVPVDFAGIPYVSGTAADQFKGPTRMFVDSTYLYVSDTGDTAGNVAPYNHRIARVKLDDYTRTNYPATFNQGSGVGQFDFPILMGILPDRKLYVMDTVNDRIVRFDADTFDGTGWEEYATGVDLAYYMTGC